MTDQTIPLRLTYQQLAARLGVGVEGARTRARRRGWPVMAGNDGKAIVLVDPAELEELTERSTAGRPATDRSVEADVNGEVTDVPTGPTVPLTDLLDMRDRLAEADSRASAAEAALVEVRAALAREQQVADEQRKELAHLRQEMGRPWWRQLLGR